MPKINLFTKIRKSKNVIYNIIKNIEDYPTFMRDVKQIKIIKLSENIVVSKWNADIDGTPVEWIEELKFNKNKIEFCMLEGDFEKYIGSWILESINNDTKITLEAQLEWGLPNFEKYVGKIFEEKACNCIRGMLWAIRKKAHKTV